MSEFKLKIGIIGGTGNYIIHSIKTIIVIILNWIFFKGLNNVNFLQDSFELEVDTLYGKPSDKLICG